MGVKITKGSVMPIGIDLGSRAVKLAQLRTVDDTLELLAAGMLEVPPAISKDPPARLDFLTEGLGRMVRGGTYRGRSVVLSLPADATFIHHVRIPKLPPAEIAKAVIWELHGKCPWPMEQSITRHVVAGDIFGDGEPKQEIVTVSAYRPTIDAYLAMARRAKLDVAAINVEACAMVECFSRLFRRAADSARTVLMLDLGETATQVVLAHGANVAFARNVAIGSARFDQALAQGMHVSAEEAHKTRRDLQRESQETLADDTMYHYLDPVLDQLVDQVTQCLRYYDSVFRNQTVERAIFLGGQAYDKRLCQAIAQRLNLPAQVGDPLVRVRRAAGAGLAMGLDRRDPQPDWAVAVGLSLGVQAA